MNIGAGRYQLTMTACFMVIGRFIVDAIEVMKEWLESIWKKCMEGIWNNKYLVDEIKCFEVRVGKAPFSASKICLEKNNSGLKKGAGGIFQPAPQFEEKAGSYNQCPSKDGSTISLGSFGTIRVH